MFPIGEVNLPYWSDAMSPPGNKRADTAGPPSPLNVSIPGGPATVAMVPAATVWPKMTADAAAKRTSIESVGHNFLPDGFSENLRNLRTTPDCPSKDQRVL